MTKYTSFTKQGNEFNVVVSNGKIYVEMGDLRSECIGVREDKKHGWYYEIAHYASIAKALKYKNGLKLLHESAQGVKEFAKKDKMDKLEKEFLALEDDAKITISKTGIYTLFSVNKMGSELKEHPCVSTALEYSSSEFIKEVTGIEATREAYVDSTDFHMTFADFKKLIEASKIKKEKYEQYSQMKKLEKEQEIEEKLAQAKLTKQKVVIEYGELEECNDPNIDCDFYIYVTYAMPNGKVETIREEKY